jgi:hypothetical protein
LTWAIRGFYQSLQENTESFKTRSGKWIKLNNDELHDLYSSSNIVRGDKNPVEIRWAGHVARMEKGEACIGFWWGNLRERDHWGDPGLEGRIILKRIFRKWDVMCEMDLAVSG